MVRETNVTAEAEVGVMQPRDVGSLSQLEKAGNRFSPRAHSPADTVRPISDF